MTTFRFTDDQLIIDDGYVGIALTLAEARELRELLGVLEAEYGVDAEPGPDASVEREERLERIAEHYPAAVAEARRAGNADAGTVLRGMLERYVSAPVGSPGFTPAGTNGNLRIRVGSCYSQSSADLATTCGLPRNHGGECRFDLDDTGAQYWIEQMRHIDRAVLYAAR